MLLRLSLVASLVACAAALHEHGATPLREGDGWTSTLLFP